MAQLAQTAGIELAGLTHQHLFHPNPATYIGSGKVEELRTEIASAKARTVIFDDELSPGQQRTLEEVLGEGVKILDRTALILDIFAQHAHSREGQIQVELAQYEYRLPRLTRLWTHLVRQAGARSAGAVGGVGLRGPGETQLEADRRQISNRIAGLKKELQEVRRHRHLQYRNRKRNGLKTVTLVGYTNAGKSSLLNALSSAQHTYPENHPQLPRPGPALVADQLFTTLDPTTRRIRLPGGTQILVTDTVGFIKKLPHNLVAAFRATLEGIAEADLLLHVIDVTHPKAEAQLQTVNEELSNLEVAGKPTLLVWNKIDRAAEILKDQYGREDGLNYVSARTGQGIPALLKQIEQLFKRDLTAIELDIPYTEGSLKNRIFEQGAVEWFRYGPAGTRLRAYVPPHLFNAAKPYRID